MFLILSLLKCINCDRHFVAYLNIGSNGNLYLVGKKFISYLIGVNSERILLILRGCLHLKVIVVIFQRVITSGSWKWPL